MWARSIFTAFILFVTTTSAWAQTVQAHLARRPAPPGAGWIWRGQRRRSGSRR